MEFVSAVIAWFADPANWMGRNGIPNRLFEHLAISAVSLGIALLIALPIGTYIGHTGRGAVVAISLTNIGRAIPSLGIIGIALPIALALHVASGFWSTVIALTALAIPPIVLNTYSGLHAVSRDLLEAGRGMGMRERQLLRRVEIPLALPIILAGVRISAVQVSPPRPSRWWSEAAPWGPSSTSAFRPGTCPRSLPARSWSRCSPS
jgi:osmoprotectant transport system permease protein